MTANAAMTWIVHFTWMSYVVFHHWTDIYIYFLVYDMRELNLGLVLEYVQHGEFCDLLLYFQI